MIWLIGSNGMLGTQIAAELTSHNIPFTASDIETDITDIKALRDYAAGRDVSVIINASAYTAVDKAESEETKAQAINADGVANIAQVASELGADIIHFSTDYIFDGTKDGAYTEDDSPNPVSAYGRTKLAGEQVITRATDRHFIFRISWLYGVYGANFVKTMVRLMNERDELGIVADQTGSPTYCGTLAANIVRLISSKSKAYGTYHYSDMGDTSWYDFAVEIHKQASAKGLCKENINIRPIKTADYPTPAKRPANSRMSKEKASGIGFTINRWQDNLGTYFDELEQTS